MVGGGGDILLCYLDNDVVLAHLVLLKQLIEGADNIRMIKINARRYRNVEYSSKRFISSE